MAQQTNNLREHLLAALPQPEKLAAYREETAALLTKHARALRWDKITANTFVFLAVLLFWWSIYPERLGPSAVHSFQFGSALMYFVGAIYAVQYKIYDSQVATLKEIKQLQLQILELQASLNKRDGIE
jgi:hypothetical protein